MGWVWANAELLRGSTSRRSRRSGPAPGLLMLVHVVECPTQRRDGVQAPFAGAADLGDNLRVLGVQRAAFLALLHQPGDSLFGLAQDVPRSHTHGTPPGSWVEGK